MAGPGDPQVRLVVGALEKFTSQAVLALSLEVMSELKERTPVDTGWARANWVPAIGTPDLTPRSNSGSIGTARQGQLAAEARLLAYDMRGGDVFISNNVPYISVLNGGSSQQAPEGFVQDAIGAAVRNVSRRFA